MTRKNPKEIVNQGLVPIIVGITGHRWMMPENHEGIQQVFDELFESYPHTPIVVLSPLADGADRLIAQIAVNNRENGKDISLIYPLPMPKDEYSNDFNDPKFPDSKKEFNDFLKEKRDAWFELPMVEGSTPVNIAAGYKDEITGKEDQGPRNEQYKQVGIYVAQYSHILIGLWDGQTIENTGGTYQILKLRHEGKLKRRNPLDEIDGGPIYHFPTTRKDKNSPAEIGQRREIFPGMDLELPKWGTDPSSRLKAERFQKVLKGIDSFNRDVKGMDAETRKSIAGNQGYVIPDDRLDDLNGFTKRLLHHYAVADTLAISYQWRFTVTLKGLFYVALIALFFFEIYAHLKPMPAILLFYPAVLGVGLIWFLYAREKTFQKKYLDYRALAEGLRVQFFWAISGRGDEVMDFYLPKQKSELDWIKYAVHSFNMAYSEEEFGEKTYADPGTIDRLRSLVLKHWVRDQAKYFGGRAPKEQQKVESHHLVGKILIAAGVLAAISISLLPHPDPSHALVPCGAEGHSCAESIRHVAIVFIAMAIAIAAAIGGYTEKAAISAQAKRYAWMSGIYKRADTELSRLLEKNELSDAKDLIFELGKEALEENGDWLIIRRERELELPAGG